MAFDVKKRKRELIKEYVKNVPEAAKGELLTRILILSIFIARAFLIVFELIFCASTETKISVWSYVLFVPFLLVIYMIYDGNKSFVSIPMISAPIRILYYFSSVLPSIEGGAAGALTVISILVLAIQFFASIVMSANSKCAIYFTAMQKVNLKVRSEMLGGKK